MDTSAVDNLEFRGEDSEECTRFISALLKYAYAQGKLRDDEWLVDFATTCFKGEALRWWMRFGPNVQRNWTQLHQGMAQKYRPSFYGRSGEEAEKFVQLVYDRAVDAGKQKDNKWIADFVITCFKGGALRWFCSLDPDVQNDWRLLQEAIFKQYPADDVSALQRTTPTPAAAVASAYPGKPVKRGRVRVTQRFDFLVAPRYLSRTLTPDGNVVCTEAIGDALEVVYDPNRDGPQDVIIPDSQIGQYDLLTLSLYHQENTGSECAGILGVLDSKTSKSSARSNYPPLKNQWKIVNDSASTSSERTTIIPATEAEQLNICVGNQDIGFYYVPINGVASLFFEPL